MASIRQPGRVGTPGLGLLACAVLFGCSAYDSRLLAVNTQQSSTDDDGGTALADGGSVQVDGGGVAPADCSKATGVVECLAANADAVCVEGSCTILRCHGGFRDCDGDGDNGCEAAPDSTEHCGGCNVECELANVEKHGCDASAGIAHCVIASDGCKAGFGDCDGNPSNGCETMLNSLNHCGACNNRCAIADSQATCEDGQCTVVGCAPGFGDCHDEGCEPLFGDAANCGACGEACPANKPNCAGGRCTSLSCGEGSADCDGDSENGCETDLTDPASCGGCQVECGPYPNAVPACNAAQCAIGSCDAGRADCDGDTENGCETDLGATAAHCGGCDNDCGALPNVAEVECREGSCAGLICKPGFDDCDGKVENGCEQPLNTLEHCGRCGKACAPPHADATCESGTCTISACEPGFDECNGQIGDGCEAKLDTAAHCGRCNHVCPAGQECRNGGCGCGGQGECPSGFECCGGSCIDTRGACVWWPCIPGTTRDYNHCGGCDRQCDKLACCG